MLQSPAQHIEEALMSQKFILGAGAALVLSLGFVVTAAEAKPRTAVSGVNQTTSFGNTGHVKANNIRLCNNRCIFYGDASGNIVGIGNMNLGPTKVGGPAAAAKGPPPRKGCGKIC
jgi:hypothetical protein